MLGRRPGTVPPAGKTFAIDTSSPTAAKPRIAKTEGLEMIPRRRLEYRGSWFEEMDTAAILARKRPSAWWTSCRTLRAGRGARQAMGGRARAAWRRAIEVLTTMNVQQPGEPQRPGIADHGNSAYAKTVPDWVLHEADEVVMVDLTPRALLNRLTRGVVYPADKARRAMDYFFKESTLVALRELALRETAHEVNVRFVDMAARLPRTQQAAAGGERLLVFVTEVESARRW